jgi:hypothetical protein
VTATSHPIRHRLAAAAAAGALLALAGCASFSEGFQQGFNSTQPTAEAPAVVDAPATVARLVSVGTATDAHTTTDESDPNHLLGRPNGYTSRATFTIPGVKTQGEDDIEGCDRGGCVEQWPSADAAKNRVAYLTEVGSKAPVLGGGYTYTRDGLVLRVSKTATPTQAETVSKAFLTA